MTEIKQRVDSPRPVESGRCPFCGGKLLKHCAFRPCEWLACANQRDCKAFGPEDGMVRL